MTDNLPRDPFVVIDSGPFVPEGTVYLLPTCDDCGEAKALCLCNLNPGPWASGMS